MNRLNDISRGSRRLLSQRQNLLALGILAACFSAQAWADECMDKYGNWVEIDDLPGNTGNVSYGNPFTCGAYNATVGQSVSTNGLYSAAFGFAAVTVGDRATALGTINFAGNHYAVAMGTGNNALTFPNVFELYGTSGYEKVQWTLGTVGERSVAMGYWNWTPADDAVAVGNSNRAFNAGTVAMGVKNAANVYSSSAIGVENTTYGAEANAVGFKNEARGDRSVAVGTLNKSTARWASAMGHYNSASGTYASALGNGNTASAQRASAVGSDNQSAGVGANAFGSFNKALAGNATAVGVNNLADQAGANALGHNNKAQAQFAVAVGGGNTAGGESASALGSANEATATGASALGYNNKATALYATAVGNGNTASGVRSIALGSRSQAVGENSTALGFEARATAGNSTAIGYQSVATQAHTVSVGSAAGRNRIVNMAAARDDNDAVNLSQLYGVATAFGGGASYAGGVFVAPTFVVQGNNYGNVRTAFDAVDDSLSAILGQLGGGGGIVGPRGYSAYDIAVQQGFVGNEQQWLDSLVGAAGPQGPVGPGGGAANPDAVAYDDANHETLTLDGPGGTRIRGVADGVDAADAVNKGQMDAGDASTLASATAYADAGDAQTLADAKAYSDNTATETLVASRAYTDQSFAELSGLSDRFDQFVGQVDQRLRAQDRRIDRQGAMSSAMLNMAINAAGSQSRAGRIAVGAGWQAGESALSIGYGKRIGKTGSFSLGGAMSHGEKSAGMGFGLDL